MWCALVQNWRMFIFADPVVAIIFNSLSVFISACVMACFLYAVVFSLHYYKLFRSLVTTYAIAAMWHGFYPGYYIFFLSLPLVTTCERLLRARLNPIFCPTYDNFHFSTYPRTFIALCYWCVSSVLSRVPMLYITQAYHMKSLERSLIALRSYYFIPHVVLLLICVVFRRLPVPKQRNQNIGTEDEEKKRSSDANRALESKKLD